MRNGGRERPCAGIPCGQTSRRHGLPKREATLARESPADRPAADTIVRNVKRPCAGILSRTNPSPARLDGLKQFSVRRPAFRHAVCAGIPSRTNPPPARLDGLKQFSVRRPAFRHAVCAGIPCGQTRCRHGCPKREAPLRGLPVRRETECPCARVLSRRPPRACRFAEEQSALARRPAFRHAVCAGIPSRQTRRRHGWPKREATLCAGAVSPTAARLPVRRGTECSCAQPAFRRAPVREFPCGQTRRRHGWPDVKRPCARPAFRHAACAGIPRGQTRRRHG